MSVLSRHTLLIILCSGVMLSCAHQTYLPKPLVASQSAQHIRAKSIDHPDFHEYLAKYGYHSAGLSFTSWNIDNLAVAALFFHEDIAVAKTKLSAAYANVDMANLRPSFGVSGNLARSNQANGDINPWSYGLQIDIPVETNQKRFIRTEEARHLAEVARMDVADVAWRLRYQLTLNITEYRAYIADLKHAKHIHNIHLEILKMLEKRLQLGLASQTEVLTARLNTQRQMAGIHQIESAIEKVIYQIAQNTGLPVSEIQRLPVSLVDIDTQLQTFDQQFKQSTDLSAYREAALLNRIDIRRGIANYAASEAKLKLEIAKQIPDISLSPGVLYEYGDKIWSLGFASLFNLLKGNATLIKQAESLRDIEGANFLALQSSVIHTIEQQIQLYLSLKQKHDDAESILVKDRAYFHRLQKQFEAGQIDRLELTVASAVLAQQASTVDRLKLDNIRQIYEIENSLQHPLLVESGQIFNANFSEIVVPIYE